MRTQRVAFITQTGSVKGNKPKKVFFETEMSVRTEPRELSAQLQQTLTIPAEVMAAQNPQMMAAMAQGQTAASMEGAMVAQGPNEQTLHEANSFNTNNEHHPLERTVCINIRASLSDLCLRSNAATWAPPSAEATKSIFQQARPGAPASFPLEPPTATPGAERADPGRSSKSGIRGLGGGGGGGALPWPWPMHSPSPFPSPSPSPSPRRALSAPAHPACPMQPPGTP